MFIILLLFGLLAMWMWSLVKMPSKQARDIFEAQGEAPSQMTARDRAYVVELHQRFGTADFRFKSIKNQTLGAKNASHFGVAQAPLDDTTELGVRLPALKMLVSFEPGRYRLTDDAARLVRTLAARQENLENMHHG
jgi:hypothetical protein